jgi:hypothetical protein
MNNKQVKLEISSEGTYYSNGLYFFYSDPNQLSYIVPITTISLFPVDVPSFQSIPQLLKSTGDITLSSNFPSSIPSTLRNAGVVNKQVSSIGQQINIEFMISSNMTVQHGNVLESWLLAHKDQYYFTGVEIESTSTYLNLNYYSNETMMMPLTQRTPCSFQNGTLYTLQLQVQSTRLVSELFDMTNYNSPVSVCIVTIAANNSESAVPYRMAIGQSVFVNTPIEARNIKSEQIMQVQVTKYFMECIVPGCNNPILVALNTTIPPTTIAPVSMREYYIMIGVVAGTVAVITLIAVLVISVAVVFVVYKKKTHTIAPVTTDTPNVLSEDEVFSNLKHETFYGF